MFVLVITNCFVLQSRQSLLDSLDFNGYMFIAKRVHMSKIIEVA